MSPQICRQVGHARRAGATGRRAVELDPANSEAFAQLGYALAFTDDLDAAEAVVEITAELPDVLARLRERSLLAAREPGAAGTLRFFLYRSIREFAAARLDAAGLRGASDGRLELERLRQQTSKLVRVFHI